MSDDETNAAHRRDYTLAAHIDRAIIELREIETALVGTRALATIQDCRRTLEHEHAAIVRRWD